METLIKEVLQTLLYGGLGLILMLASMFIFDLAVPYDFKKELKEKKCGLRIYDSWNIHISCYYNKNSNYVKNRRE